MQAALTGALRHADGAVLILGIGIGFHFVFLFVVDECLGTLGNAGPRVVEVSTSLRVVNATHNAQTGMNMQVC